MARHAPTVNGTPTYKQVSYHFVDASGDKRSVSVKAGASATNLQIESLGVALGNASNAELYEISVSEVYAVVPDATYATDDSKDSVFDNIVIMLKNAIGNAENVFIPAPIADMFVAGTDNPNPVITELDAVMLASTTLVQTRYSGAVPVSLRYTERREINSKVNI